MRPLDQFKIRAYRADDWDDICRIYDAAKRLELRAAGVEAGFLALRDDVKSQESFGRFDVLVCEDAEGQPLGFSAFKNEYIGWLFVHPDSHRRGIGRALLHTMLGRIPGEAWLWTLTGNDAAFALYSSEGFRPIEARYANVHGHTCTAVKMVRGTTRTSGTSGTTGTSGNARGSRG